MITVRVRSPEQLIAEMNRFQRTVPEAVKRAMWLYARLVMNDAQKQVPVDFGFLRSTGYVNDPYDEADRICLELGFYSTYAAAVHNIPEPPAKSEGGRSAHHERGKWHYLSDPLDQHQPEMVRYIVEHVEAMYGGEV